MRGTRAGNAGGMTYRTTRRADQDIIDAYLHGAMRFGVAQAERYHRDMIATFGLLAAHPGMARLRAELVPPVRLHPYGAHLIVYRDAADGILIIRLLHGRQDWERLPGGMA